MENACPKGRPIIVRVSSVAMPAKRHAPLVAKLKSLTTLRAVRDPKTDTGWTIELGPFPGGKDVPTW